MEYNRENEKGLIEVKNFLQTNNYLIKNAVQKGSNLCLGKHSDSLTLRKTAHRIYYQIQKELNVYKEPWCDFVLRGVDPYDMFIKRIYCDDSLWKTQMITTLQEFHFEFTLPELALTRYGTYSGIRELTPPWVSKF